MKFFKFKTLSGLLLAGSAAFAGSASAAVVDFTGMPNAIYGAANIAGSRTGGCGGLIGGCFVQNGIVVGTVFDPLDAGSHIHKPTTSSEPTDPNEVEYHVDSTGMYVRMENLSKFSLQSIDLNVKLGASGGNFVLYGYADPRNNLLTDSVGTPFPSGNSNPTDPEGGNVPYIASYVLPNDGAFDRVLTLTDLLAQDSDWGNIGAFWLTFQGKNHSPTVSYEPGSYPDWNIRIDDINLGAAVTAPVPVPGAVWLFGSALVGFISRNRKKASV